MVKGFTMNQDYKNSTLNRGEDAILATVTPATSKEMRWLTWMQSADQLLVKYCLAESFSRRL